MSGLVDELHVDDSGPCKINLIVNGELVKCGGQINWIVKSSSFFNFWMKAELGQVHFAIGYWPPRGIISYPLLSTSETKGA